MEDYIKCELIDGRSRYLNTFSNLFIIAIHISIHAMYCCSTLHAYQYMLCIVAIHYTHISTCYVLLLYTTHISIHALYC